MAYTTINKSTDYFNTKLYTGNGSTNAITGVGFQPDWVWIKHRGDTHDHNAYDAVRGVTKMITPNENYAESTVSDSLTSFDSDGFTLGNVARSNASGGSLVSWNWKANGQGSSNTDGTINSTYTSANTTSGFSIVSYTGNGTLGATVGHGLGQTPSVFLTKRLSGTSSWGMYHQSTGAGGFMEFNGTSGLQSNVAYFNNTAPTSSVFSIGTDAINNTSGSTYIAYCFAEKKGFSAMGSYTGNGNIDGPFNYCGFKPAFLMLKKTSGTGDWFINDVKRNTFNVVNTQLYPNLNAAEENVNATQLDILSNGFKLRGTTSNALNSGNDTYIYMAFAEEPLVSSNGVSATAR